MIPTWQESLFSMQQQYELDHPDQIEQIQNMESLENTQSTDQLISDDNVPQTPSHHKYDGVPRRDLRILMILRHILKEQQEHEDTIRRAKTITKTDPAEFVPKPNTLEHFIYVAIANAGKEGVHIDQIIMQAEQAGCLFSSAHHKYAQVNSVIRRNEYMYLKTKPATFTLRGGFIKQAIDNVDAIEPFHHTDNHIPSLKEIAHKIMIKYRDRKYTPKQIWRVMNRNGYDCSLEYIESVFRKTRTIKKIRVLNKRAPLHQKKK